MRLLALLLGLAIVCVGCGGYTPPPNDGAFPIYNTVWTGTFAVVSGSGTGTVTLTIGPTGAVTGIWQDYNNLVYTMSGTASTSGALGGSFTNAATSSNGTFTGAISTQGTGTISSATATGTMTITFGAAFTDYSVNLKYSGVPKFKRSTE